MPNSSVIPLSVVIPVFSRQAGLERAIASVAAQDAVPAEILVIDDGSPIPAVVPPQANGVPVRLFRHDVNRGAAAARSIGLAAATTDYVTFLDSDDLLLPGTLGARWAYVAERLGSGGGPSMIFASGWQDVAPDGTLLRQRIPRPGRSAADFASGCWFSPGSCVILHGRAALAAAGPQDSELRRFEDFDWFLALSLHGFTLEVTSVIGVTIERRREVNPALAEAAAEAISRKWRAQALAPSLLRRIDAYLDLELASAHYYAGKRVAGLYRLARSFAAVPRTTLQLSPGWE